VVEGTALIDARIQAIGVQQLDNLARQLRVAAPGMHGNNSAGKPPKSCQVSGAALPLTSNS